MSLSKPTARDEAAAILRQALHMRREIPLDLETGVWSTFDAAYEGEEDLDQEKLLEVERLLASALEKRRLAATFRTAK